jgi:hypothetical protein
METLSPEVAAAMAAACVFSAPARAGLDDRERQRQMRREKHESLRDAPPPLPASQRGLKYGKALRGLFYALSGARRSNDLERIEILTYGGLEVEVLRRETVMRWADDIVADCTSGLFGRSAADLCGFLGFESDCPLDYPTFASSLVGSFTRAGLDSDTQLLLLRDACAHFTHHRTAFEATVVETILSKK